jgi:hypothetical protein
MKPRYAHPSDTLDCSLEQLVAARLVPGELIFQWTQPGDDGVATICLIEDAVYRVHSGLSEAMGGLCAGGGRSLIYKLADHGWEFIEEQGWVS